MRATTICRLRRISFHHNRSRRARGSRRSGDHRSVAVPHRLHRPRSIIAVICSRLSPAELREPHSCRITLWWSHAPFAERAPEHRTRSGAANAIHFDGLSAFRSLTLTYECRPRHMGATGVLRPSAVTFQNAVSIALVSASYAAQEIRDEVGFFQAIQAHARDPATLPSDAV